MYYPKNTIVTGLYTNGGEFVVKANGKAYKGEYFRSKIDNKIFSGKEPSNSSVELLPAIDKNLKYYTLDGAKYLLSTNANDQEKKVPTTVVPVPTEANYKDGFLIRYFMKRANGDLSTIKEIDQNGYNLLNRNILYFRTSFKWKITGTLKDNLSDPNNPIYGIEDTNRRTLLKEEKVVSGISQVLKDLKQFARVSQ